MHFPFILFHSTCKAALHSQFYHSNSRFRNSILFLLFLVFVSFITDFKPCFIEPHRHLPQHSELFCHVVWYCGFSSKSLLPWNFCKERYKVGWDSDSSNHKRNREENGSKDFVRQVCTGRISAPDKWEPSAWRAHKYVFLPGSQSIFRHLYVCYEGWLHSKALLSHFSQVNISCHSS